MGTAGRDFEHDREDEPYCRICASDIPRNNGVHIFAEDGRRHYLQTKIRKYLYILVSSEDKLSKMVCVTCIKRLEGIHRFAMMAYRTQEKLKSQFYSNNVNTDSQDAETEDVKTVQEATKRIEDRGLLHTILTKGAIEILAEGEPLGPSEFISQKDKCHTPNTEEMEVKVDPMLFLQYGMEHSTSETSDASDTEEKISRIDSLEPLPLTNKTDGIKREKKEEMDDDTQEDAQEVVSNVSSKPHECTICTRSFVSQIALQNHLWSHLPKDKQTDGKPILRSQQVYSTNGALHVNADSNSSGNFVCPICSKKISTKGNLKVHLETHRPKGKYGCDICGRIFKTQSNLFRHKEYHGGIQFPCNVCGRVYPTNSTLRAHSITHSDLRPHACPLCDKTFKRNQDLKFHINQHTGARPYQCPYCPKAFASSGNCFSHRKRMHPREVYRDRQRAADLMR
ncbi:zinc finger protein 177-like [Ceratina calcarata]|uniref:Zinc finger protein 177-like n=1 Tax=Ceratina calcarata TaxID=156304 RepID=A0AAJ7NEZ7_9HYME|nr:zinc finger protein 177-like [Ceratina calcarata]